MTDIRAMGAKSDATAPAKSRTKYSIRLMLYAQLVIVDFIAVIAGFFTAEYLNGERWISPAGVNVGALAAPLYVLLAINRNAYSIHVLRDQAESLRRAITALFMAMLIILMFGFFFKADPLVSRLSFAIGIVASAASLALARLAFHYFARQQVNGHLTDELFIADGFMPATIPSRYAIDAQAEGIEPDLHNPLMLSRLAQYLAGFDRVVVACPPERQHAWALLLKGANIQGELLLPKSNPIGVLGLDRFGDSETLIVSRGPLSMPNRAKKRMLDLLVTVPALIALSPLFLVIALAIRLETPGPVFFKQQRVGRSNQWFNILKFRSMRVEVCDAQGARSTARDDDRITRVGAFIRKTSIDELPQLINVLRGDMSLVGPRPHALGSLAGDRLFWEVNERYWMRHALKPGITGLAQIRGYRGATVEEADLENRLSADLEYVHSWRLWRDISILFATLKVLVHRNAY